MAIVNPMPEITKPVLMVDYLSNWNMVEYIIVHI